MKPFRRLRIYLELQHRLRIMPGDRGLPLDVPDLAPEPPPPPPPPPPDKGLPLGRGERAVISAIRTIDRLAYWSGYVFCWLTAILMAAIVYNVVMRYVFGTPARWAYDVSYMLYGTIFMLGAAYTLYRQGHIRTDFLYQRWSPRWQGIVDSLFYILLFFPAMILFFQAGYDYAARSWAIGERGYMSPWRPPLYPFKTVIPVAIALITIQGVSELLRSLYAAVKGRWP